MTASVACPVCSGKLTVQNDDIRDEWERIYYHCTTCDDTYERLITFKTQSNMVANDEWVGLDTLPYHIVMYYDDDGGTHPIITILEVASLDETEVRIAIADYLIEEHDFDIEEVVDNKEHINYFRIDSNVVVQLQVIDWPSFLTLSSVGSNLPTVMGVRTKLAVYKAFRIEED